MGVIPDAKASNRPRRRFADQGGRRATVISAASVFLDQVSRLDG